MLRAAAGFAFGGRPQGNRYGRQPSDHEAREMRSGQQAPTIWRGILTCPASEPGRPDAWRELCPEIPDGRRTLSPGGMGRPAEKTIADPPRCDHPRPVRKGRHPRAPRSCLCRHETTCRWNRDRPAVELPINRHQAGEIVGLSRNTVGKLLADLAPDGIVECGYARLVTHRDRLGVAPGQDGRSVGPPIPSPVPRSRSSDASRHPPPRHGGRRGGSSWARKDASRP